MNYLHVVLRGIQFALPSERIIAITSNSRISAVPLTADNIRGVMYYDGKLLPVIDLSGVCKGNPTIEIVYREDKQLVVYAVDSVEGFIDLSSSEVEYLIDNTQDNSVELGILRIDERGD